MGDNIVELGSGGVVVRTIAGGTRLGFTKPTPCFAISTLGRSATHDYIVLTRDEAVKVALGILLDEMRRTGSGHRAALQAMANHLCVDLDKLMEFD